MSGGTSGETGPTPESEPDAESHAEVDLEAEAEPAARAQAEIAAEAEAEELELMERLERDPHRDFESFFPGEGQLNEIDGFAEPPHHHDGED